MKRHILITLMLCLACIAQSKSLVITLTDNTEVYYLLGGAKNPVMRFADGKLFVNSDAYEFSNIRNYRISDTDDPNPKLGDVNLDGDINVFDVVAIADFVLNGSGEINIKAADMNGDNQIDVFDVVALADKILNQSDTSNK